MNAQPRPAVPSGRKRGFPGGASSDGCRGGGVSGDPRFSHELTDGSFGCSSCGLDFASTEAFDQHRHFTGRRNDWARRACVDVQSSPDWVSGRARAGRLRSSWVRRRSYVATTPPIAPLRTRTIPPWPSGLTDSQEAKKDLVRPSTYP